MEGKNTQFDKLANVAHAFGLYEPSRKPAKYPVAGSCGHKVDTSRQPRFSNCESCWFFFFASHKDLVETADTLYQQYGRKVLAQFQGLKFADNFVKFMSTLAQWQKLSEGNTTTNKEAV